MNNLDKDDSFEQQEIKNIDLYQSIDTNTTTVDTIAYAKATNDLDTSTEEDKKDIFEDNSLGISVKMNQLMQEANRRRGNFRALTRKSTNLSKNNDNCDENESRNYILSSSTEYLDESNNASGNDITQVNIFTNSSDFILSADKLKSKKKNS